MAVTRVIFWKRLLNQSKTKTAFMLENFVQSLSNIGVIYNISDVILVLQAIENENV